MDIFSIASSGLQAAQAQLNVTASNIANADTPGYQARRVDLAASPDGVEVTGVSSTGQGVNLASQMVGLGQARMLYDANAMVVKVANQMYGTLLDAVAS